jgi:ADP-heptose:LPS heptosyltransferase
VNRALLYCAGGGIGDSLVASIVARALRQRYGTVDALTLPGHAAALRRVPDVDDVLTDDGGDEKSLSSRLRERQYGACIVTWATLRAARVAQNAGIPVRVGQARRLYSYRFTIRVPVRSENGDVTSHWSQILLDYARALGCDAADAVYRFVPTQADGDEAAQLLAQIDAGGSPAGEGFVILSPCNAIAPKVPAWPTGGWARLGAELRRRLRARVLVGGDVSDAALAQAVARDAGAVSIAGSASIGAFGALAQRARAFVGITTGSMHVAAAAGCPTVGIFPFQSDVPDRWAPLGPRTAVVRPFYRCHRGDTKERCRDYACVEAIDPARVIAALETLG